jgi:hypothetical protein
MPLIDDARRAYLAQEWRTVTAQDEAVKSAHLLAASTEEETLLQIEADAQAEATRRQTMRGVLRHRYEFTVALTSETDTLDLGDVVQLTYSRYGMSGGKLYRIIGLEPDAANRTLTLTVWGPADPTSLMRVRLAMAGTGSVS